MMKYLLTVCMLLVFGAVACAQTLTDVQRGNGNLEPAVDAEAAMPAGNARLEYAGADDAVKTLPADTLPDSLALMLDDDVDKVVFLVEGERLDALD